MVTYRRELERKGWHRPLLLRTVLVVVGLFIGLVGWAAWSLEQDKGGWEGSGLGHHMVEQAGPDEPVIIRGEDNEILFEGTTIEEADAWIESQRRRNFTTPALILAGGVLLLVLGLAPSPRKPEPGEAPSRSGVAA